MKISAPELADLYLNLKYDLQDIKLDSNGKPKSKKNKLVKDLHDLKPYCSLCGDDSLYKVLSADVLETNGSIINISSKMNENIESDLKNVISTFEKKTHQKVYPNPMTGQLYIDMIRKSKIEYWSVKILSFVSKPDYDFDELKICFQHLFKLCPPDSEDRSVYYQTLYKEPVEIIQLNIGRILVVNDLCVTYDSKQNLVIESKQPKIIKHAVAMYLKRMKNQNKKLESINKSVLLHARKILTTVYKNQSDDKPLSSRLKDVESVQKILKMVHQDYDGMFKYSEQYHDLNMICYEPPFWKIRSLCGLLCYDLFYNKYPHEIRNEKFHLSRALIFGRRFKNNHGDWYFDKNQPLGIDKRFAE